MILPVTRRKKIITAYYWSHNLMVNLSHSFYCSVLLEQCTDNDVEGVETQHTYLLWHKRDKSLSESRNDCHIKEDESLRTT